MADVPRATLGDREARELGIEPLDARAIPAFERLGRAPSRQCRQCKAPVVTVLDTRTHCADPLDAVIAAALNPRERRPQVPALAEDRFASDMFDGADPDRVPELEDALQAALTQRDVARGECDVALGRVAYLEREVQQLRAALRWERERR